MTQNSKQTTTTRVLPFRVPAQKFEEIKDHIKFAAHIVGLDAPLDSEHRNTTCRRLRDTLCALAEIKKANDYRI